MKTLILALFLIMMTSHSVAHAKDLSVDDLAKLCNQKVLKLSTCGAIRVSRVEQFSPSQQTRMLALIDESTGSWGDSIFEGEVDSNMDDLRYSVPKKLLKRASGDLLGYEVRFSYLGWETSDCAGDSSYDRTKPDTYESCKKGRIYQTIYMTADLKSYDIITDAELLLDK